MTTWNSETVERNIADLKFHSVGDETGFSWQPCFACRRKLGGDRHDLHYVGDDGETYTEEICTDCVIYIANGETPEEAE